MPNSIAHERIFYIVYITFPILYQFEEDVTDSGPSAESTLFPDHEDNER